MNMTETEIIRMLGGVTTVAKMLGIKPPSVQGWLKTGIPEGRLIELASEIEHRSKGAFTRQQLRPTDWQRIWPELAQTSAAHPSNSPARQA